MSDEVRVRHKVTGEKLLQKFKEVVHEGNVRRIIIKDEQERTIIEIPLTLGVVGAVVVPMFVAVGAIAALAAHYTIEIEKQVAKEPPAVVKERPRATAKAT